MEQQILQILSTIEPLGWPAALIVFVLYGLPKIIGLVDKKWVKNNLLPKAEMDLAEIKENHLHSISETLVRIERRLEKLDEISEGIIYVKARINGK